MNRVDITLSGSTPYPRHFTCETADVKIIDMILAKENAEETYVAFEYFPPRTASGVENLYNRFGEMAKQGSSLLTAMQMPVHFSPVCGARRTIGKAKALRRGKKLESAIPLSVGCQLLQIMSR
jgi:hypothetical protein